MSWPEGLALAPLLSGEEAAAAMAALVEEVAWEGHSFTIFGRTVPMPRRIQMYGPHGYDYSGVRHPPRALTPTLRALQTRVQDALARPFNSVLCNLYRDGADGMAWHTDDDYEHGGQPVIASLSLGATRRFRLRPRGGGPGLSIDLVAGDLLTIDGAARTDWQHAVPKTRRAVGPRINLTWRQIQAP
ncbi:MAG: alpha-ketoglutarate-dependent dioxygenase AlkB [Alphaproteobacteria bacterium]|nr:alpha-ketoglutarate-dependent dioxygenase AlkB [Alphaproteobacteria bacterium]